MPGIGFNPVQFPRDVLSTNTLDIESYLFGINSTNLVTPTKPSTPNLRRLDSIDLFIKPKVIMPPIFSITPNQRPFIP